MKCLQFDLWSQITPAVFTERPGGYRDLVTVIDQMARESQGKVLRTTGSLKARKKDSDFDDSSGGLNEPLLGFDTIPLLGRSRLASMRFY